MRSRSAFRRTSPEYSILQKPIHDIDIFMKDEHVEEAADLLRSYCGYVKVGEWKEYLGFSDPAMTRVAKFEKADETIPVCIIGLLPDFASPRDNIARFDFGVCMAAFDGKQTMRAAEFDQDEKARTFTLCRADNQAQFNYSLSRFEKITAARYTGWSLIVPHEFEETRQRTRPPASLVSRLRQRLRRRKYSEAQRANSGTPIDRRGAAQRMGGAALTSEGGSGHGKAADHNPSALVASIRPRWP
jgi:hypothetical protein